MPTRRPFPSPAVLALAALVLAGAACAAGRAAATAVPRTPHPDLGVAAADAESCASCHEGITPAVVKEWNAGAHGVNLVKCFVCHGSTGPDFLASPTPQRCNGCHAAQVESVSKTGGTIGCFGCHAPHTLRTAGKPNPHAS